MRRKSSEVLVRLATLAILSALGFVLMAFAQFPYPAAPWLKIEVSEIVTLIAFAMYGFGGGAFVALVKTALNLAYHGPVALGIGDLTALFTSMMFLLGLFLTSHIFKWFKKGIGHRILGYVFTTILVTVVLTVLNGIFITPSYLTVYGDHPHFSTCFDEGMIQGVVDYLAPGKTTSANGWIYVGVISSLYGPFNLLKAGLIFVVYELVFNRIIFVLMKRSPKMKKYFASGAILKDKRNAEEEQTLTEGLEEDVKEAETEEVKAEENKLEETK